MEFLVLWNSRKLESDVKDEIMLDNHLFDVRNSWSSALRVNDYGHAMLRSNWMHVREFLRIIFDLTYDYIRRNVSFFGIWISVTPVSGRSRKTSQMSEKQNKKTSIIISFTCNNNNERRRFTIIGYTTQMLSRSGRETKVIRERFQMEFYENHQLLNHFPIGYSSFNVSMFITLRFTSRINNWFLCVSFFFLFLLLSLSISCTHVSENRNYYCLVAAWDRRFFFSSKYTYMRYVFNCFREL